MLDFLSQFLFAVIACFPCLYFGALLALFPQQQQDKHIEGWERRFRRFPFLKWLFPFQEEMYAPSAVIWNRAGGFICVGMGSFFFFFILFSH
jgi:hypothetical protein